MEENDASFENDSDGNVKAEGNVKTPDNEPAVTVEPGKTTTINWDTGKDKGETNGGSDPIEVDPSEKAPSTGKNPTGQGEPITGEAGDAVNGSGSGASGGGSGSGGPRVDEGGRGSQAGTPGKRVYNNMGELKKEVEGERKNIKDIAGKLVKDCKERQNALQGKVNQAGAKHNSLAKGVFGKLPTPSPTSPPAPLPPPRPGSGKQPKTPPNAPLGQKVKRTYFHLEFALANAPPQSKPFIEAAKDTFDKADELCTIGDLENGNQALDTVDDLTEAALSPDSQPSPPGEPPSAGADPETQQRSNAQNTCLVLCEAANKLNDAGFPNLANSLRFTAGDLLNYGLGWARSSDLIDIPFNIIEAFAGKTIEFGDSGEVVIRDVTNVERVFALVGVAVAIGVIATDGLPALIGVSVLGAADKEIVEKFAKLVSKIKDAVRKGDSFDIPEFPGYPDGVSKPSGPFKYRTKAEVDALRPSAKNANKKFQKDNSLPKSKDIQIHHKQPLKWGGDPTDPNNLEPLDTQIHTRVTNWWNALQRAIEKAE